MDKLFTLLDLLVGIRKQDTIKKLAFFAVNETHKLISYDQAVFWRLHSGRIRFETISGNHTIDENGPFAQTLTRLINSELKSHSINQEREEAEPEHVINLIDTPNTKLDKEVFLNHRLIAIFADPEGNTRGGLFIQRTKGAFNEAEINLLEELAKSYAYALINLTKSENKSLSIRELLNTYRLVIIIALIALAFFPVRLSITAPAEIVSRDSFLLTVPFDGTLEDILVDPGSAISEGDQVAQMEADSLRARAELAEESLNAARTNLSLMRRGLISDPDQRGRIGLVEAEISRLQVEADYARDLLARATITAPQDGVAIFAGVDSLTGRPLRTGDPVMEIADPASKELLIRVPVDAMIPITSNSPVDYYLNVAPLTGYSAKMHSIGYQASPDPDGLLTYKLRGRILSSAEDQRIGWQGTATIKGDWSILAYAILRQPFAALRRLTGI